MKVHTIKVGRETRELGALVGDVEQRFFFTSRDELMAFREQARARGWSVIGMSAPGGAETTSVVEAISELDKHDPRPVDVDPDV